MNLKKVGSILAPLYSCIYLLAVFTPRSQAFEVAVKQANLLKRLLLRILYYGGSLEPVGNFFLLIPIFLLLVTIPKKPQTLVALATCLVVSALAEFAQRFIPGRVSSLFDCGLNMAGVFISFLLYRHLKRSKFNLKV